MTARDEARARAALHGVDAAAWWDRVAAIIAVAWPEDDFEDLCGWSPEVADLIDGPGWREWEDDPAGCAAWILNQFD